MHLQVVDKSGATIPFSKALGRYAVFGVPYFLSEATFPVTRTPWAVSTMAFLIISGLGGATFYLMLFNRRTRQGVHDLVAGSYVADADIVGPLRTQPIWTMHWVILGSLLVVLSIAAGVVNSKVTKWGTSAQLSTYGQLLEDVRLIEGLEGVEAARAQDSVGHADEQKSTVLVINVYWSGNSDDEPALARKVAGLILQHDPSAQKHDSIRIEINRGYVLGMASAHIAHVYQHTPSEWSAILLG
jgi:hypothetical protein